MDITDEYIEMCRKAKEIQKQWKYHSGDYGHRFRHVSILHTVGIEQFRYTWLPRQDQLQDMLYNTLEGLLLNPLCFIHRCYKIMGTVAYTYHKDEQNWDTMEKLWLSFVMYEKYNKIWNSSEWINLDR